jgi:UDP-N-acetylmuramate: L-alanyl-gamma-D-glutamyl-meso-diaminopimelate ligase
VRAVINGITIIDDFAHHPTAIRETLRALRSVYPQSRLWAVLEPRSNTLRRKVLQNDLVASLRSPTASCWPASTSSSAFPTPSGCIPKT